MTASNTEQLIKQVLIVDDEPDVVKALSIRCASLGLTVQKAYDAVEAMKILVEKRIDLALLDLDMPGPDGLTLCETILHSDAVEPCPVILLTGRDSEDTRDRCAEMGVRFVKKDPEAWQVLESLIRRLMEDELHTGGLPGSTESQSAPCRKCILIVDDDAELAHCLEPRFNAAGYDILSATTGMDGYWKAIKEQPDLVLLDYKMPGAWGNSVLGKLSTNAATSHIPVVMLSGMTDLGVQRDVLRLGAKSWINKPFDAASLILQIQKILGDA
jgi:DNA-binding response OmpR family regulator